MKGQYSFNSRVIFRRALRNFSDLSFISDDNSDKKEFLDQKREDQLFLNALKNAAPSLASKLLKSDSDSSNESLFRKILEYDIRHCTRPTPFGLWAGVGLAELSDKETKPEFKLKRFYLYEKYLKNAERRKTDEAKHEIFSSILTLNPTLLKRGDQYRYFYKDTLSDEEEIEYAELDSGEELDFLIETAKNGISFNDLLQKIKVRFIKSTEEDCIDFIKDSLQMGLLELYYSNSVKSKSINIKSTLLDPTVYKELSRYGYDGWNVNSVFKPAQISLEDDLKKDIVDLLGFLKSTEPDKQDHDIKEFKDKFYQRYSSRKLNLLEVFDADSGITFGDDSLSVYSPAPMLQSFLDPQKGNSKLTLNSYACDLLRKVYPLIIEGKEQVDVSKLYSENIGDKKLEDQVYSVFVKFYNHGKKQTTHFKVANSANPLYLSSRFAKSDSAIANLLKEGSKKDKSSEEVTAEIKYFPSGKANEIVDHPPFYDNEIGIFTSSSPGVDTIGLKDIYLSVENQKLVLTKGFDGPKIRVKLSNAHNFRRSKLPVYRFLAALSYDQGNPNLIFSWHGLDDVLDYLPRIVFRNILLKPKTWKIRKKNFDQLSINSVMEYLHSLKIPDRVYLCDGDRELFLDLKSTVMQDLLYAKFKSSDYIVLKEFPVKDASLDELESFELNMFLERCNYDRT